MNTITPKRDEFLSAVQNGRTIPLHAELDAAAMTPLAALHALRPLGHPVLLESARVNGRTGQYSFVTADPYLIFRSQGDTVDLDWTAAPQGKYGKRASLKRKPLPKLRELMANYRTERVEGLPPFTGGAVGYFSYEFAHQFEKLPRAAKDDLNLPEACFLFVDLVVAFDHIAGKVWVIVTPGRGSRRWASGSPTRTSGEGCTTRQRSGSRMSAAGCPGRAAAIPTGLDRGPAAAGSVSSLS